MLEATFPWSTVMFYMFADSRTRAKGGGLVFDRIYRSKTTKRETRAYRGHIIDRSRKGQFAVQLHVVHRHHCAVHNEAAPARGPHTDKAQSAVTKGCCFCCYCGTARHNIKQGGFVRISYDEQGGNATCALKNERAQVRRHANPMGAISPKHTTSWVTSGVLTAGHTPP